MQYTGYTFHIVGQLPEGLDHETVYDLLSADLGELGFDSFEAVEGEEFRAYVPTDLVNDEALDLVLRAFPIMGITFTYESEKQPDVNWNEEWEKNYFQPIILGDGLCMIRAPFHEKREDVRTEIIISPKMAFGTGNHETTALVIGYLLDHEAELRGRAVLDMGCGTGILGLLALKLGAASLTAIDIDEWAYQNVLENARLNGVHLPDALQGDASSLDGRGPYDLVLANITRNILMEDLPAYARVMKSGARIILSGFYEDDAPMLIACGSALGLSYLSQRSHNRWTLLELRKD